jgi:dephospho-CoA kinase
VVLGRIRHYAALLDIAVTSVSPADATAVAESWRSLAGDVRVDVIAWPPDLATAAGYQLVVGVDDGAAQRHPQAWIDVWTDAAGAHRLWPERLAPFRDNLAANRRAPRRQVAALVEPDPTWPRQARLLIARLERTLGDAAVRIDHIGSTSVPGLPAKNLVDIQVVVPDLGIADGAAAHARDAGFVRVPGRWTGPDRQGMQFEEIVLVDADPGRPVNVNLRPVGDPVWRETLRFRDWLRADVANRDRYLAFKRHLVETTADVDEYSDGKLTWIGAALDEASQWAESVGRDPSP